MMPGKGLRLGRVSRFFATPCFPPGYGPDYINACAILHGLSDPVDILSRLHGIEASFDRARTDRWGARTLDLDLIAVGDRVLPDAATQTRWRAIDPDRQRAVTPDRLILPHPRLQERAFVLVPLADIAPDWVHPVTAVSVRAMLRALPAKDRDAVVPV